MLIERFFPDRKAKIDRLEAQHSRTEADRMELEEAEAGDDGALAGLEGKSGITKGNVEKRVTELREAVMRTFASDTRQYRQAVDIRKRTFATDPWPEGTEDPDGFFRELDVLRDWLRRSGLTIRVKSHLAEERDALQHALLSAYQSLDDDKSRDLLAEGKWLDVGRRAVAGASLGAPGPRISRVQTLDVRYAQPLPALVQRSERLRARVSNHLLKMGQAWR